MARIPNKHLKVFASEANNNGVFGSAADNTKILSDDVEVIQSKAAWEEGWLEAVIGTLKFPTLEEFQACNYVNTSFISYVLQEGIPEWNPNKEYYQNSIVKRAGTYEIYGSITDNNVGNAVTDTLNWKYLQDLSLSTVPNATTVLRGIAMLATSADVLAGNNDKIVTPNMLAEFGFRTGDWKGTTLSTLQDGWIWAAGDIGNASSGATNRANADCEALFKAYWNDAAYNYTGTTATGAALQVFNSSGVAVAKGVSADADWNANRRIAVPDYRDRVPAGRGNMVGNAGRLSGQSGGVSGNGLGNSGGAETHSLTESQNAQHDHLSPATSRRDSTSSIAAQVNFGKGPQNVGGANNRVFGHSDNNYPRSNFYTSMSGEGSPHNNVQPTIITNIIIKL